MHNDNSPGSVFPEGCRHNDGSACAPSSTHKCGVGSLGGHLLGKLLLFIKEIL